MRLRANTLRDSHSDSYSLIEFLCYPSSYFSIKPNPDVMQTCIFHAAYLNVCRSAAQTELAQFSSYRKSKETESSQTYRVDNAFESVEAIFDRKHVVFGVRNISKLLESWKRGVNKERCWSNTALCLFLFSFLWLNAVFPLVLRAGGDGADGRTVANTLLNYKKNFCSTNWEQYCLCFVVSFFLT